ncbi:MAG: PAS domain S-box protein [Bacteroidales bacterium]|nr:PAS domain S-box protein [Bacteroidales bacterium]
MSATALKKVIEVNSDKCVNCHTCITACPVKYCNDGTGDYVNVNENMCIGCGKCIKACTHDARIYLDDFQKFLTDVIAGEKIIAISAPAVAASFPNQYLKLNTFFKEIGIEAIFDVSFGAELAVKSYLDEIETNNPKTIITQPCAAIVTYIELYKPELLKYLAPVDSPMLHTIKMIKEYYPQYKNHKVVIISPCSAKKREFEETGLGDYNIGHQSIQKFIKESKVDLANFEDTDFDNPSAERAVLFSNPGGLLKTAERWIPGISDNARKIEGVPLIYEYLETLPEVIKAGKAPVLIDCLSCEFGCNSGPLTITEGKSQDEIEFYVNKRSEELKQKYLEENDNDKEQSKESLEDLIHEYWKKDLYKRTYVNRWQNVNLKYPNDGELDEIFKSMHKYLDDDIKNCSACGYGTCKGMAIAILNGLNRPENCHFYLAQQAIISNENTRLSKEKLSNILSTSIDGFVEFNNNEVITKANDAFKNILKQNDIIGRSIYEFMDDENKTIYEKRISKRKKNNNSSFEVEFIQSDKNKIPCLISASELKVSGKIIGSFAMVSDVSNLKKAEAELRQINETLEEKVKERTIELSEAFEEVSQRNEEIFQQREEIMAQRDALEDSEERIKYILSSMPDASFVIDKNSRVTHWNNAMEKLTGIDASDIIGKGDYEYSLPFYGERKPVLIDLVKLKDGELKDKYSNIKNINGILESEFILNNENGGINGCFIGRAVAIYDNEGNTSGAIEIIHDITEKAEFLKKIEKQKKNITDNIQYASYIQEALLPPETQVTEYLSDSFILFKPRDIVSGDFYWVEKYNNDIIIVAADCTGHGVSGAFMSMLGISFLNEIIIKNKIIEPNEILNELRKSVKKALRQTEKSTRGNDGMDMSVAVINPDTNIIRFAGANNPLFIIRNNEIIVYKADKMPVGIYPKDSESFSSTEIEVQKDDVFYLFSDGYVDQMNEKTGRKYMKKRFKELLVKIHKLPMKEQKNILEKEYSEWKGSSEQIDDMLVLGFKL